MRKLRFWLMLFTVCGFLTANQTACVSNENMKVVLADKYYYPTILEFKDNNRFFVIDELDSGDIYEEDANNNAVTVDYPSIFGDRQPKKGVVLCANAGIFYETLTPICSEGRYAGR